MPDNLLKQLEQYLEITERSLPDVDRVAFFITFAGARKGMIDKAKEVFEEYHLKDLNVEKRENVFVFEVYKRAMPDKQGVGNLKSALRKLDGLGIEGIVGPYPVSRKSK